MSADTRALVEAKVQEILAGRTSDRQEIRARLLADVAEEIDRKLGAVKCGQGLICTFRVDVIDAQGQIVDGPSEAQVIRGSIEMRAWRASVLARDGACVQCGAEADLHAHHIKSFAHHPELRFDVANGETLCATCHGERHPWLKRFISGAPIGDD